MHPVVLDALRSARKMLCEVLEGCDERFDEQAEIAAEVRVVLVKLAMALAEAA